MEYRSWKEQKAVYPKTLDTAGCEHQQRDYIKSKGGVLCKERVFI